MRLADNGLGGNTVLSSQLRNSVFSKGDPNLLSRIAADALQEQASNRSSLKSKDVTDPSYGLFQRLRNLVSLRDGTRTMSFGRHKLL